MPIAGRFAFALAVSPCKGTGEDRAAVVEVGGDLVIVLADGAGGTGGGELAAQAIVDDATRHARDLPSWGDVLAALDQVPARLRHGQATAVVMTLSSTGIEGASVGDSGAWLIRGDAIEDLTAGQHRKPLVGSGASPVAFRAGPLGDATLLVASDGLLRYAKPRDIARVLGETDLDAAPARLIDLVRLTSGALPDDVSVVVCRDAAGKPRLRVSSSP